MISVIQLGTIDYATSLRLQQQLVALRKEEKIGDVLLLLEHPPVITLGRNAKAANVVASPAILSQRGVELYECDRGGDVTFHGPGQIVGYPIFDLRGFASSPPLSSRAKENGEPANRSPQSRDPLLSGATTTPAGSANQEGHNFSRADRGVEREAALAAAVPRKHIGVIDFVRRLEEALIRTCADFTIPTKRVPGLTGVWTDPVESNEKNMSFRAEENDPLADHSLESRDLLLRNASTTIAKKPNREGHDFSRAASSQKKEAALAAEGNNAQSKLAAIGVHISRFVTSHGFALNVNPDLSYFNLIIPCGITSKPVTSMQRELGHPLDLNAVAQSISRNFGTVFQSQILWLDSLDALLDKCGAGAPAGVP